MIYIFKKLDFIFFLYLLTNVLISLIYHGFFKIVLKAEDLWTGQSIYSDTTVSYNTGDIIIVDFKENLKFNIQLDQSNDKKLNIKLIPDKLLFDYLPDVNDTRTSQKGIKNHNKDQISFQSKIPMKIININNSNITLEGVRQINFNNLNYLIQFRGETQNSFIKNRQVLSTNIANLIIQIQIVEQTNQNLSLENEKIQIDDATKRKILIEYLKKILEEQNFNVP